MKIKEIGTRILDFILNHLIYIGLFLLVIASFSILYNNLSEYKNNSLPTEAAPFITSNTDNYKRDTLVVATIGKDKVSYQNKYGEFYPEEEGIYKRISEGQYGFGSWENFNERDTVYIRAYLYLDKLQDNIPSSHWADYSNEITNDKLFNISYNTSDWKKDSDGWWYYKKPLKMGELSSPLIKEISASKDTRAYFKDNNGVNLLVDIDYSIALPEENYKEAFSYTESDGYKELVREHYENRNSLEKEK